MQSGGGASGRGMGPTVAPPPPGRPSSSSSASPSSSSSAVSAPRVGFDSLKQQLAWRQSLQQQQLHLRKPEEGSLMTHNIGAVHGVAVGNAFPSSSGAPALQSPSLPPDHSRQFREVKQPSGHCQEQPKNHIPPAYVQFAMQAAQQQQRSQENLTLPQGGKFGIMGPPIRDQDMHVNNLKMQELASMRGNQTQALRFTNSVEQAGQHQKHNKQGSAIDVLKTEMKPTQSVTGQFTPTSMFRPVQSQQLLGNMGSIANNQLMMAQLQAMQTWAMERNIDLTHPANANLLAQFLPILHSNRLPVMPKSNASAISAQNSNVSTSKTEIISSPVDSENSAQGNSMNSQTGQGRTLRSGVGSDLLNPSNMQAHQHQPLNIVRNAKQNERGEITGVAGGSSAFSLHPPQGSMSPSQTIDLPSSKHKSSGSESLQVQFLKQSQRAPLSPSPLSDAARSQVQVQGAAVHMEKQPTGFTKQQLHVLKAQILAFRRLKRGERALPPEVLQAISPPPLESQIQSPFLSSGTTNQEKMAGQIVGEHERQLDKNEVPQIAHPSDCSIPKLLPSGDKKIQLANPMVVEIVDRNEFSQTASAASAGKVQEAYPVSVKSEQDVDEDGSLKCVTDGEKVKSPPLASAPVDSGHAKQIATTNVNEPSKDLAVKKYHGPLLDFPSFIRKYDGLGLSAINNSISFALAYDIKELLYEERKVVLSKRRAENMKKITNLLSFNSERRRIRPDIVLRLQIEEKKLRLLDIQARLRDAVDEQQQEIMTMPDRPYRKFVRQCERQRAELLRHVQQLQKATRERQLKSIFLWRKKFLETHWAIRDARTTRNRGVAKYHEKMLREYSKRKDDDRNKRMEALKNNDVDRYRQMLLEQQTSITGDGAQRYVVLSSFLSQTEEYLHKLGAKITTTKKQQDLEEAANAAANAARAQGLSEEEVKAAAACAREEVMIRNTFSEMNAPQERSSVNKYYNLAHAINERVVRQPSMLRAGTLRDYQLVGLQWMLSLYNNKLNGILADEMGLGKTVQVMALIAYLMEFKGNYGPHLIIVPNAVLVNWKSELHNWLPSASCIFYVGIKEERSRLFSHEVCAMKFNVLVTTYEFIMYDRSKLSKIDWKYIIIDEAQRMKDRESVLARDLDRYRCQRRLLLTGTPLQNDLKELWSLLNLLLPEIFDNRKAFHDWFSKPFQKDGSSHSPEEDDWLETEKKVIVIHRLHQILEPFMLRRRVEDVEGSLPPKVSVVLRCRMSGMQGAIYDWIKSTGTIRVDPEDELRRSERNPMYQMKMYRNLNNKCMELRKACNHPLLNYPYFSAYSKDFLVRSCGKLWVLDRILIKLQRAGHRVLLFSTMTKLLDILEEYLQWRRLVYRRIDGSTSLEDRESAIVDFNSPYSECFIFLLSIRAAGRGLNLQTADTVVIYDPDPNPQNEEQAVARAHRIGQSREVKVIYMESVVDKISSYQKEDEIRSGGGSGDSEDDLAGKDRYIGSVESLIRNQIQQYKIDMADEVINAGRFDQRTTHEERRMTLETLLHDEERYQETVHDVPSLQEVNRMIARSEGEVELFDQMDDDFDWTGDLMKHTQVPKWLRVCSNESDAVVSSLSKKPSKNNLGNVVDFGNKRVQRKSLAVLKYSSYVEFDEEDGEEGSDASSDEDRGIGEVEEEEEDMSGAGLLEEEGDGDEGRRHAHMSEEAGSTGSSFGNRRGHQSTISSTSLHKFGSLTELGARPNILSTKSDELEEGEIAVSGDSHVDIQHSGSWNHDLDDVHGEQVLQPKLKRKRSIRPRPTYAVAKLESRSERGSQPLLHAKPSGSFSNKSPSSLKKMNGVPTRGVPIVNTQKLVEDAVDRSRESWTCRANANSAGPTRSKMSDSMQRKCKNVISKLQRRIDKEGCLIAPVIYDIWKTNDPSNLATKFSKTNNPFDLPRIDNRIDNLEYEGVEDFIADVQSLLKNVVHYCKYSQEVKYEARKLHDIFFDIMRIAFPDSDFREAKALLTFPSPGQGGAVPKQGMKPCTLQHGKHPRAFDPEREHSPPRPATRTPTTVKTAHGAREPDRSWLNATKVERESRPIPRSRVEPDGSLARSLLTHPGELVICKKRRKDRDKSSARARAGPLSPASQGRGSPFSPGANGGSRSPALKGSAPPAQSLRSAMEEVQWARPVKRMRTDTGKRRPVQF